MGRHQKGGGGEATGGREHESAGSAISEFSLPGGWVGDRNKTHNRDRDAKKAQAACN